MLFLGLAVAYGVSAFASGASLTTLSEAGTWSACAGVAFLAAAQNGEKRARWMGVLAWFGIATAVGGIAVCTGSVPLADGMVGERLQFTFQYANAAAAWYGIIAFLCLLSPGERQRSFAALPVSALLLTESGGALAVFAVIVVALCLLWVRAKQWSRLLHALAQVVVAIALFAVVRATLSPVAFVALAVALVACWGLGKLGKGASGIERRIDARAASLALAGIIVACTVVGLALLSGRVVDAIASFGERLYHMRDGVSLWLSQPVLGVGPDNWQYLYQYIQTAPYYTSVVHCSYVQLLLDAGIAGLAFFAAAGVLGMRGLARDSKSPTARGGWARAELLAATFLLAHALFDFDFQFSSLAFVLVLFLSAPECGAPAATDATDAVDAADAVGSADEGGAAARAGGAKGLAAGLSCLLVSLPMCAIGLLSASTSAALDLAEASGDYETCKRVFQTSSLAQADVSAQSSYIAACHNEGDDDEVEAAYELMAAPSDRAVLYVAAVYYARNEQDKATAVLADRLEEHPYDTEFLASALRLADAHGVGSAESARFNVAVSEVRALTGENADGGEQ